ncbi:hypothetical protein EMMF5_001283 [Cystobasidiomycetes sp. EMM_F5]
MTVGKRKVKAEDDDDDDDYGTVRKAGRSSNSKDKAKVKDATDDDDDEDVKPGKGKKRAKTAKADDGVEKRLAKFKAKCPKALLTSELKEIFEAAPPAPAAQLGNHNLTKAWQKVTGSPSKAKEEDAEPEGVPKGKRRWPPNEEDTCPVCYEDIAGEDESLFSFCETSCGGPVHKECMANWVTATRAKGEQPTCVFCREPWLLPGAAGGAGAGPANPNAPPEYSEGYLNLASTVGVSRQRDSSTYYHGPRAGVRARDAYFQAAAKYGGYGGAYRGDAYLWERGYDL